MGDHDETHHQREVEKRFKTIVAKAKKLGLNDKEIEKLLEDDCGKSSSKFRNIFVIVFAIICASSYCVHANSSDRCWIRMPNIVTKATRPPEDCSMCADVLEVQRVSNVTRDEFEKYYAYTGTPVVVEDGARDWRALEMFNFEFLRKVYTETYLGKAARDCQFFPYKTEFSSLFDVLEMEDERANLTPGTKPWYVGWSNCHDSTARILRQYYEKPYFLPRNSENNPIDWIFMGGPGDGAQMHVDNVVHPSWQAQIKGRKRWQLAPPPECFYKCSFMEVTVHPGEIIVIDTNRWYHKTEVLPGEISLTIGAEYD